MQIKVTRRYHYTTIRMAKRKKLTIPSAGQDLKQQELLDRDGGNANGTATLENSLTSFYHALYNLEISFLDLYLREINSSSHKILYRIL